MIALGLELIMLMILLMSNDGALHRHFLQQPLSLSCTSAICTMLLKTVIYLFRKLFLLTQHDSHETNDDLEIIDNKFKFD